MGIRFACHVCDKRLNIKQELAGKRGVCPGCSSRIRIPLTDAETSTPVDAKGPAASIVESHYTDSARGQVELDASHEALNAARTNAAAVASSAQTTFVSDESSAMGLLSSDPDATWYVRPPSGGQYGPATTDVLRQWIGEGRVATRSLLWRDGWPQWREAIEVFPELAGRLPESSLRQTGTNLPAQAQAPAFAGGHRSSLAGGVDLGAAQRSRSTQRLMAIGLLSTLAITLIVVLVIVANRS